MSRKLPHEVGRSIFGADARGYARARLDYPPELFALLRQRYGLRPGCRVLEIGAGTGIATRELLRQGAESVLAVEADPRMARWLRRSFAPPLGKVRVVISPFETADLPAMQFDLVVAATSFHWLEQRRGVRRVASALRPGHWFACWGNQHGDPTRPNAWFRATHPIFKALPSSPASRRVGRHGHTRGHSGYLDLPRTLRTTGAFDLIDRKVIRWTVTLTAKQVVALYATFSDVRSLPPEVADRFLRDILTLARDRFHNRVVIRMRTPLVVARRTSFGRRGPGARATQGSRSATRGAPAPRAAARRGSGSHRSSADRLGRGR